MFSSDEGHEGTGDGEDIQDGLDIVQDAEPVPGQSGIGPFFHRTVTA